MDGSTGKPVAHVQVKLEGGGSEGETQTRTFETGADGRYSFGKLPAGDQFVYVVDAFYRGGLFAGRALQLPSDTSESPVIDTTVKVWAPTTDPTVIGLPRDDLFAISSKEGLGVIESVSVLNSSGLAYIGRGGEDGSAGKVPTLGFTLPEGAADVQILDSNLDIPKLVATDFGFATTVAIPPGETKITFSYSLPESDAQFELSRNVLYPTGEISVYTRSPLTVASNRLVESGEKSIEGTTYNVWKSEKGLIESGDPIQILVTADAGKSATLLAGVGALGVVLLLGIVFALRRRARPATEPRPAGSARDQLLTKIARLDLAFETGDVSKEEWARRRARLKNALEDEEPRT